ncbi:MAG: hypothetical protein LH702_26890 [Phormidesmis sp. CAN_BIN44]|nr:hypothetical protein [Phormidesmis sp. CAN_BIN44]
MSNPRIRLSPQTIDAVTELGQRCGIEDLDTVIKLLIRKYGDQLAELLSPVDPNRDTLTLSVPHSAVIDSKPTQLAANGAKPSPPPRTRITGLD